ncbi:hypothetical protein AAZX31_07G080700 [Glycine max]
MKHTLLKFYISSTAKDKQKHEHVQKIKSMEKSMKIVLNKKGTQNMGGDITGWSARPKRGQLRRTRPLNQNRHCPFCVSATKNQNKFI